MGSVREAHGDVLPWWELHSSTVPSLEHNVSVDIDQKP